MFHGTGQSREDMYENTGWRKLVDKENLVVIYPESLQYCSIEDGVQGKTKKWTCGEFYEIVCSNEIIHDDELFVRKMLDTIKATLPVDPCKTFVSGFSNGGCFAAQLGLRMNDVFTAVTYCGGAVADRDTSKINPKIPMWRVMGTRDDKFTEPLGVQELPYNDSILTIASRGINNALYSLQLTRDTQKVIGPKTITYIFDTPEPGTAPGEFRFTIVDNMFHVYPDGVNDPMDIAPIFWDYFEKQCLRTSVAPVSESILKLTVFPNPFQSDIFLETTGNGQLRVFTFTGNIVDQAFLIEGKHHLQLDHLPDGYYWIEFNGNTQPLVKIKSF
jgi:predicted esterase